MKKILFIVAFISSAVNVSAQTYTCTDLGTSNLTRGSESKNVLMLQQFLYAKGLLSATPNGYFGNATFSAVKAYQKSIGLSQVGNTGPSTRAAIKKETCTKTSTSPQQQAVTTSSSTAVSTSGASSASTQPRPVLSSLEKGTLLKGAQASWNVVIRGTSLSTTTNKVYFRNTYSNRKYSVGSFASLDTTSITLPSNLMATSISCGVACSEQLPLGSYEITVEDEGGESNALYTQVRGFSISSTSGSVISSLRQNATNVRLGTVSFACGTPCMVTDVSTSFASEGLTQDPFSITYKDEATGQAWTSGTGTVVGENESKIFGIYGNISSTSTGSFSGTVSVTINDFVGGKPVTFTSPSFLDTVSGFE